MLKRDAILRTNKEWIESLECKLRNEGTKITHGPRRDMAEAVLAKTIVEVRRGLVHGPFTKQEMDERFGEGEWRPMARFPVKQKESVRAVDDANASRSNEAASVPETIYLPSSSFPAEVAIMLFRIADELGIPFDDLALGLALDDIDAAYRRIPTSQPEYTGVALWNPTEACVQYFVVLGHNFGLVPAVTNFCRIPALQTAFARRFFAIAMAAYIDDNMIVDLVSGKDSAQESVVGQYGAIGIPLAPEKRKRLAQRQVELGVVCDLSNANTDGVVSLSPTEGRKEAILQDLRAARDKNYMSSGEAQRMSGRLGFLLSTAFKRVGRAATQPLIQRAHIDVETGFSESMEHMLEFFEVLFPLIPPKIINVFPVRTQAAQTKPLIMYTDACFSREYAGLGAVLIMPSGRVLFAALECPKWIRERLNSDAVTVIAQLELIAVVLANVTFSCYLTDQRVIYFEDNTVALCAMIHGYAKRADMARVANMYHLQNFFLRVDA
jgi:hypothetical protein